MSSLSSSSRQSGGLMQALGSLNPFKNPVFKQGERKSFPKARQDYGHVPRSYGLNRSDPEPTERPKPTESRPAGRISRESTGTRSESTAHSDLNDDALDAPAPKATVGSPGAAGASHASGEAGAVGRSCAQGRGTGTGAGNAIDIELGYPAAEILQYWRQKEVAKQIVVKEPPRQDYVMHRRYMVDWLSEVGEQLDLQTVTIHSAISFLDEMMMLLDYSHRQWRLQAVCCLSVAAKYEEAECNMPMISELADSTELSLTTSIVTRGELELAKRLKWDVSRVTAMHFLGYYLAKGVTLPQDRCQGRPLVDKVVRYMKKYVEFFANLCQQDFHFQQYLPSKLAAASVLAARRALCISPIWRPELTELTGYSHDAAAECGEKLWSFYETMFPTHRPLRTEATSSKKPSSSSSAAPAAATAASASGSAAEASKGGGGGGGGASRTAFSKRAPAAGVVAPHSRIVE